MTLLGNSTFERMISFAQAQKVVAIPHREEKRALIVVSFPTF
jgi:hypothetical protein